MRTDLDGRAIELRTRGQLLGVLQTGGTAVWLEVKRGGRLYTANLTAALVTGDPLIMERVLPRPEAAAGGDGGLVSAP